MYINYAHAYIFKDDMLPLTRGTATPHLLGTSANLDHVTTTNTVHNEKLINRKGFIYKIMLPSIRKKMIEKNSISANLSDFGGRYPPGLETPNLESKICKSDKSLWGDEQVEKSYNVGIPKMLIPLLDGFYRLSSPL